MLKNYEIRTGWKHEQITGTFPASAGLDVKVGPDGRYVHYPGSTVTFMLPEACMAYVKRKRDRLYERIWMTGMLAEGLPDAAMHLTLHDLVSPDMAEYQFGSGKYDNAVMDSLEKANEVLSGLRKEFAGDRIRLVPDKIVNFVSASVVLLLKPETEGNYLLLRELYHRFDKVVPVPYPYTPHVTLAYFRPGMIFGDLLAGVIREIQAGEGREVFEFRPEDLVVQKFMNLASYSAVAA